MTEKSLLGVDWGKIIQKKDVIKACQEIIVSSRDFTIPMCDPKRQLPVFKNPQDQELKGIKGFFESTMNAGIFEGLFDGTNAMVHTLTEIIKIVDTSWGEKELDAGLTYKKLTILQLIQRASFISRRTRRLIDHVYALAELHALATTGQRPGIIINLPKEKISEVMGTAKEIKDVRDTLREVVLTLRLFTVTGNGLKHILDGLPDVNATAKNDVALVNAHDGNENIIDPLNLRVFIRGMASEGLGLLSPIYHIRAFFVDQEMDAYKMAKDELELAESRKMHLERLLKGEHSPKLEETIKYEVNRISKLRHHVDTMEEKYGK